MDKLDKKHFTKEIKKVISDYTDGTFETGLEIVELLEDISEEMEDSIYQQMDINSIT